MKRFSVNRAYCRAFVLFAWGLSAEILANGPSVMAENMSPADWLAASAKTVSPAQSDLLTRAQTTLLGNAASGYAWKPYLGIMPSLGTYCGIWNWDSAFHAVSVSRWDSKLTREQLEILFNR